MQKTNQSGIAHLMLIASVFILAAIGGIGWYIMNKNPSGKQAIQVSSNDTEKVIQPSEKKQTAIPDGWQWFTGKNDEVKFAYPKDWGTLAEVNTTDPSEYNGTSGNFMWPVIITKKPDFLTQVRKSFHDPTWYSWDTASNSLASASDQQAPSDPTVSQNYTRPIALGPKKIFTPHMVSGQAKHPIFMELGTGAMSCGMSHYFFDVKDYVVHLTASLCSRDSEREMQPNQRYTDIVEGPLKELYDYVEL